MTTSAEVLDRLARRNKVGTRERQTYLCCECSQTVRVMRLIRRRGELVEPTDLELPKRRFVEHKAPGGRCRGSGQQLAIVRGFDR